MSARVAIIGGGIAGLTAAYLLRRRYEITLFEKSHRLGGNAFTYDTRDGHSPDIAVAAFGKAGYPLFYRLLDELRIGTAMCPSSYMSFHDLDTRNGLYITPGIRGLMAQGFSLLNPAHLKSFSRLFQGLKEAQRRRAAGTFDGKTLAEALEGIPQISGETRIIFLCALCLLSSMDAQDILASPAWFFFEKLAVHHDVMSPRSIYSVRCVEGERVVTSKPWRSLAAIAFDCVPQSAPSCATTEVSLSSWKMDQRRASMKLFLPATPTRR
ncbi:MAG: FAD-dependent oxidoreductase [Deltaproteobacteria bacterium]|nr:FAD-dependent oxidoreductase [Deltaproteobacteria bacterium]